MRLFFWNVEKIS